MQYRPQADKNMVGPKPKNNRGQQSKKYGWAKAKKTMGGYIMTSGFPPPFTTWWRPPKGIDSLCSHHFVFRLWASHVLSAFGRYCLFWLWPRNVFSALGPRCTFMRLFYQLPCKSCVISFPVSAAVKCL